MRIGNFPRTLTIFFVLVIAHQSYATQFSESEWSELASLVKQFEAKAVQNPDSKSGRIQSQNLQIEEEILSTLKQLNIEIPMTVIRAVYKKYAIISFRHLRSNTLLVGCGNKPIDSLGDAHLHLDKDTVDPDFHKNPSVVGFLGSEGFNEYLKDQGKQYELIETEGLRLPSLKYLYVQKEMLNRIADALLPRGQFRPVPIPEIAIVPGKLPKASLATNHEGWPVDFVLIAPELEITSYFQNYQSVANVVINALQKTSWEDMVDEVQTKVDQESESLPVLQRIHSVWNEHLIQQLDGTAFKSVDIGPIRRSTPFTDVIFQHSRNRERIIGVHLRNSIKPGFARDARGNIWRIKPWFKKGTMEVQFSYVSLIKE